MNIVQIGNVGELLEHLGDDLIEYLVLKKKEAAVCVQTVHIASL